jgi:hypothetical protein
MAAMNENFVVITDVKKPAEPIITGTLYDRITAVAETLGQLSDNGGGDDNNHPSYAEFKIETQYRSSRPNEPHEKHTLVWSAPMQPETGYARCTITLAYHNNSDFHNSPANSFVFRLDGGTSAPIQTSKSEFGLLKMYIKKKAESLGL